MPWIMRATPDDFDLAARLAVVDCWILEWSVQPNVKGGRDSIQIGDRVWFAILQATGTFGAIIGRGTILSKVVEAISPERDLTPPFCLNRGKFQGPFPRVFVEITERFPQPFPLANERQNPALQDMLIFKVANQSMFWVTEEEAAELSRLIS
jgi:predicted RNA-binding protein with PUA-like domain